MSMFFQFEGTDNIFSSAYSENMVDGFRTIFVNIGVRVHIWTDFDWIWTAFMGLSELLIHSLQF